MTADELDALVGRLAEGSDDWATSMALRKEASAALTALREERDHLQRNHKGLVDLATMETVRAVNAEAKLVESGNAATFEARRGADQMRRRLDAEHERDQATARAIAAETALAECRKGIQDYLDGNYDNPRKYRAQGPQTKCPHGHYYYEDCDCCTGDHFAKLLDASAIRARGGVGEKTGP